MLRLENKLVTVRQTTQNMMTAFKTMASAEADAGGIGAKFGNRLVQALIDLQMDIAGGDTNASFGQYDTDLRTILNGAPS